tara:strand:- start:672 stop:785 length:114 start_codon:yes stop_codon:yes gene_type:complete
MDNNNIVLTSFEIDIYDILVLQTADGDLITINIIVHD